MPRRRALTLTGVAAATALALAAPTASAPPGYRVIFSGRPKGGGAWKLAASRQILSGRPAVCLRFTTTSSVGVASSGRGCAGGSLTDWDNVFSIASGYASGFNMNLVGGFAVSAARKAVVSFADGKQVTVVTRNGPLGLRHALGVPIRFFVVNAFPRTKAAARSVSVLDAQGREIGRNKLGP
jgi:hypothetical protein